MITDSPVTWVKVEKPVFDLPGVILSSLGIAGLCALASILLGSLLGAVLIRRARARRLSGRAEEALTLRVIRT
ncbi:MAG TPA: hypothetical protein VFM88_03400 [Vicinamibacteria bacterium]|nr:hypothetical protein [Vicinamibacteria bacterium]